MRTVLRVAVHDRPMMRSPGAVSSDARTYARFASFSAVSLDENESGSQPSPPRRSIVADAAYGTLASSTVFEAPGTDNSVPITYKAILTYSELIECRTLYTRARHVRHSV